VLLFHISAPICSLLIVMDKWKVGCKLNRICFVLTLHMEEWYINVIDIRWYLLEWHFIWITGTTAELMGWLGRVVKTCNGTQLYVLCVCVFVCVCGWVGGWVGMCVWCVCVCVVCVCGVCVLLSFWETILRVKNYGTNICYRMCRGVGVHSLTLLNIHKIHTWAKNPLVI